MKKEYWALWLFLVFLVLVFPPSSTGGHFYEGHMFIGNIGEIYPRPGGGYIEGQILWKRLAFEALIVSVFIALLKALNVLERLGVISESLNVDQHSSHLSIEKIGEIIRHETLLRELVSSTPKEFSQVRVVGYLFMERLPIITLNGEPVRETAKTVFKDYGLPVMMFESATPVRFGRSQCNYKFYALDANIVLEVFPSSLLTEFVVFGVAGINSESGYIDRMLASAAVMDTFQAFDPRKSIQLNQFVQDFLAKFEINS